MYVCVELVLIDILVSQLGPQTKILSSAPACLSIALEAFYLA